MIYVFLADGFEMIEALAPVDMLGRAKLSVKTVGVTGKCVKSSGGVEVVADITTDQVNFADMDMMILPGGMPGTLNLEADTTVQKSIDYCVANGKYIAAICAAPTILAHKHLLDGKKATVFPTFADDLKAAKYTAGAVETDGLFITARGAGVCIPFGLKCVEVLTTKQIAQTIQSQIQS
ncbi:MAG: DJ-1/PfpI family protein [Ruminococcaceae bacterium]|nr:DJ-1/PfpI family protein [Oscillospiraceae bacterium]